MYTVKTIIEQCQWKFVSSLYYWVFEQVTAHFSKGQFFDTSHCC